MAKFNQTWQASSLGDRDRSESCSISAPGPSGGLGVAPPMAEVADSQRSYVDLKVLKPFHIVCKYLCGGRIRSSRAVGVTPFCN